jgi:type VI secretion system protein ImpA
MAAPQDSSTPAVIDIEKLLAPVSAENPVGEDLRRLVAQSGKSILMDEIEEKRRAIISGVNEYLEQGEQADPAAQTQKKRGEWREIERTITTAFGKGKELGAGVTLVLAAVSGRGWGALAPGFRFLRMLQERYWDALHPVVENDDAGNPDFVDRLVLLERLDHENYLPLALRQLGLTDPKLGAQFSWSDFRQLEILKSGKAGENENAEARRVMIDEKSRAIEDAAEKSTLAFYDGLIKSIDEGSRELGALRDFINEKYAAAPEEERPGFRKIEESIEEARAIASRYWKKKGGGAEEDKPEGGADSGDGGGGGGHTVPTGDVVAMLERALAQLRTHQRHNPAAFLVEEAIRWTKMPISAWYLETINDPSMSGFVSKLMGALRGDGSTPPEGQ